MKIFNTKNKSPWGSQSKRADEIERELRKIARAGYRGSDINKFLKSFDKNLAGAALAAMSNREIRELAKEVAAEEGSESGKTSKRIFTVKRGRA